MGCKNLTKREVWAMDRKEIIVKVLKEFEDARDKEQWLPQELFDDAVDTLQNDNETVHKGFMEYFKDEFKYVLGEILRKEEDKVDKGKPPEKSVMLFTMSMPIIGGHVSEIAKKFWILGYAFGRMEAQLKGRPLSLTYEQIGKEAGLSKGDLALYVKYMKTRWEATEQMKCQSGYAREWADRFAHGDEYGYSDTEGQAVLKKLSRAYHDR
jgi:hypothetical protein